MTARHAPLLLVALFLSGALGAPFLRGEVPFEAVQRAHFDALGVLREEGAPSAAPLALRVQLVGDATDADISAAKAWLAEHANVRLVPSGDGAPLFLTRADLSATSGRATLGATVSQGMAVEMRDPDAGNCVLAHEVLHFLGLRHVPDRENVMYAHCRAGQLEDATIEPWQRARVDAIAAVKATTLTGVETWARR
ncbi:MAG TPA: hypothetical protein VHH36_09750 [Candidatus Thermoplasmatota archaeon]|nr:hypothetical protein [Candidatus Thermoplasmatota archaeon]